MAMAAVNPTASLVRQHAPRRRELGAEILA
jgi:hypothetical protein